MCGVKGTECFICDWKSYSSGFEIRSGVYVGRISEYFDLPHCMYWLVE